jgi:hypothetical protein
MITCLKVIQSKKILISIDILLLIVIQKDSCVSEGNQVVVLNRSSHHLSLKWAHNASNPADKIRKQQTHKKVWNHIKPLCSYSGDTGDPNKPDEEWGEGTKRNSLLGVTFNNHSSVSNHHIGVRTIYSFRCDTFLRYHSCLL